MAILGTAEVEIIADVSKVDDQVIGAFEDAGKKAANEFDRSVSRNMDGPVGESMKRTGEGMGRSLLTSFGGALAAGGALQALRGLSDAAAESEKVAKLTEQVIASTGGAAGITAEHVDKLSTALSKKAGMDDEAIASGQNLLLQFTNLRNEAGQGNDIYDRTAKVMVDMAAKMGTDPVSAAQKLGKALNSPGEALSRLKKEGIDFTEEQEAMIQAMADSGDTAGAQRAILDALESKYKGAGEAAATNGMRMQVAWENVQEQIGAKAMPAFEALFGMLFDKVIPAIAKLIDWVARPELIGAFAAIAAVLVASAIPAMYAWVAANVAAGVAFVAAHAPIIAVGAAIAALVAGVIYAYTHFETFRQVVDTAAAFMRDVVTTAFGAMRTVIETVMPAIQVIIETVWSAVRIYIETVMGVIRGVIDVVMGVITGDWQRVWDGIRQIVQTVWDGIRELIGLALGLLRDSLGLAMDGIRELMRLAWEAVKDLTKAAFDFIVDQVSALPRRILDFLGAITGAARDIGNGLVNAVMNIVGTLGDKVWSAVNEIPGKIRSLLGAIGSAAAEIGSSLVSGIVNGLSQIPGLASDFAGAFSDAVRRVVNEHVIGRINSLLEFEVPVPLGPNIHINPPDIPYLARGGNTDGGLAVVGELGPELVQFGGRAAVFPNNRFEDAVERALAAVGGGGGGVSINVRIDNVSGTADAYGVGRTIAVAAYRAMMSQGLTLTARKATNR